MANINVPPVSHVSSPKPNMSKEDEKNRKASLLIDKIRSFRQLKQEYKDKGNLERHREFHDKLHAADKEYRKLGFKSLMKQNDHIVEEVEQIDEMPKGNDPYSQGVRVAMGSKEMVRRYTPGSEEHKQFTAGHALGKDKVKKKLDSLEPKIKPKTDSLIRSPYASQMGKKSQGVEEAEDKFSYNLIEATSKFLSLDTSSKSISNKSLHEQEDPEITSKVAKHVGDPDVMHIGSTKQGHHVYAHSESDRGEASYYSVHHPGGKITNHVVEHGGESVSSQELSKPGEHHNVHDLHPSVRKIIHKDLKDNYSDYDD